MAGKYRGTAAIIQSSHPAAVYVHRAAHTLNLCVVAASSIQCVKNNNDEHYGGSSLIHHNVNLNWKRT